MSPQKQYIMKDARTRILSIPMSFQLRSRIGDSYVFLRFLRVWLSLSPALLLFAAAVDVPTATCCLDGYLSRCQRTKSKCAIIVCCSDGMRSQLMSGVPSAGADHLATGSYFHMNIGCV